MKEVTIKTSGMTCTSCEKAIIRALLKVDGITEARADYVTETTKVKYDESKVDIAKMKEAVEGAGYDFGGEAKESKNGKKKGGWKLPFFG